MSVIDNKTHITVAGVSEEVTAEELAQALAIIKESKAPKFRLRLPWSPQHASTTTVLLWNESELKFEMQEESYNQDANYREVFTDRYLEENVRPHVTYADWNYIQWLKPEPEV